eukprot:XP_003978709.1 PREDICTED: somatostatin receptor type 3 [Takifugu rubripes]
MELIQATRNSLLPCTAVSCVRELIPTSWAPPDPLYILPTSDASFILDDTTQNISTHELGSHPSLTAVFIPLIYGMVCVVGLVGNTLVIHVIVHYTKNESVTNIYILNLAIADELFMLGLPFLAVQNALLSWPFGSLMCRVVMTVDAINQFTSIFCLTVMSVDRYLAVVHPIRSFWWRRPRVAKAISTTVWAGSFVVVLPVVVFADVLKDDGNCSIVWPEPAEVWKTSFIVYTCTVGFFCPLLVICLCYLLIVVKVRSVGKKAQATSSRRRKSERKITRMVVVVVAVFVLCWLPFYVLNIVNLQVVLPGDFRGLYVFVVVLSYANSCANPILYGFLSDNFKRGFRKALCGSPPRVNHHQAVTEPQRPTEECGGIVLQVQKMEHTQNKRCGEDEEDKDGEAGSGAHVSEICKSAVNGCSSADGSRTQVEQRRSSEPKSSYHNVSSRDWGQGELDSDPAVSSGSGRSTKRKTQPEDSAGKHSVLETSNL